MDIALPKIIQFGIFNSKTVFKNMTVTKPRKTHLFEIELPIEDGGISYIDSEQCRLKPGIIICAKPGQIRHTKLHFKCYYIHFSLPEGELYDQLMSLPNFLKTEKYQKYYEIFRKLCDFQGDDTDEIMQLSLLFKLIYDLINDSKSQTENQTNPRQYATIRELTSYIENNLSADLSLDSLSEITGYSPTHFHKLFKSATGKTIHEFVEEMRIKKAVNLLMATDYTLSQIAYECGFSSQSYFSYAFRRAKNMTPRQYAREVLKKYDATDI